MVKHTQTIRRLLLFRVSDNFVGLALKGLKLFHYYHEKLHYLWDKVFKNGTIKICGRQPPKILRDMDVLSRPYPFKFFKGCLPQILLGSLLNSLFHKSDRVLNTSEPQSKFF